ncbi:MAG: class I SAM-dependent methyltransferase [Solirubrobacterales bacterium]|nr:class I SAM-dependent methyltransferase [Solirubrobacterales bacterium]
MPPALTQDEYALHLPPAAGGLDQDEEWCEIEVGGDRRRIRFHDYADIYGIPGLYEQLFAKRLECNSPQVVSELLRDELEDSGVDVGGVRALDFGAGNGMVGEELLEIGVGEIVGVDLLEEARDAALRDRPGIYDDYHALDMTDLDDAARGELDGRDFDCMTCVAALGFGDVPPQAFAEAFNFVSAPGWIAFNIREHFLDDEDASGFSRLIARMLREGAVEERVRMRYRHRLSLSGEPLHYLAVVAAKHGDIPMEWADAA